MNAVTKVKPEHAGEVVAMPGAETAENRFMALIERTANQPEVLEKVIKVRNDEILRLAQIAFDEAYADMQPKLPPIQRKGASNNGVYAKWEDIQEKVNPVIHQHGFGLMFKTDTSGGKIKVTAILRHRQGHRESTDFELAPDKSGNKQDVHAVASAVSYAKRYAASALLNIRTIGEDDDAGAAQGDPPITAEEVSAFTIKVENHEASMDRLLKAVGATSLTEITPKQFRSAVSKLDAWIATQPKKAGAK